MPSLLRSLGRRLLPCPLALSSLLLLAGLLPARAQVAPLTSDPARAFRPAAFRQAAAARRPASVALPFFDDFANARYGTRPDPVLWDTTSGATRNETFARQPVSRGVVTFDGLDRFGRSYGSNGVGATDTLTSRAIDLSGRQDVVLSFWWQAGGLSNRFPPSGNSQRLSLDFDDGSGFWDPQIWTRAGPATTTPFEQVFISVPAQYLTGNFRFRFRSTGSVIGAINTWSIDYVELDANRQPQPATLRDVALSQTPNLPLKRFSAMPVWQFNAAANPADELADSVYTTVNNLEPDPLATSTALQVEGLLTTRENGSPVQTESFLSRTLVVLPATRDTPLRSALRANLPAAPVPITSTYKTLTSTLLLVSGELTPETQYNDTLRRTCPLNTYYAHDDGTPELAFNFQNPADPRAVCVPFDLNTNDQVAGVELYIAGGAVPNTLLFVDVWADDPARPGWPALTALAHVGFRVPADTVLRRTRGWWPVYFPPVAVSQRFYVGYSITGNIPSIPATNLGLDVNDTVRLLDQSFKRQFTDAWEHQRFIDAPGRLMIRALMNNNGQIPVGLPPVVALVAPLTVFPNPVSATGAAELHLPTSGHDVKTATLLDALGRVVRTAPPGAATLSVRGLAPGVYVLHLPLSSGPRSIRVLVTE